MSPLCCIIAGIASPNASIQGNEFDTVCTYLIILTEDTYIKMPGKVC
jgi:hypothetical protein